MLRVMKLHASVLLFAVAAIGSLAACGSVVAADGKRNGTANAGNTAVGNAEAQPVVEQITGLAAPLGISLCQWGFRCGEISERTYFDSADACAGFMSAHFDTLAIAPGSGMTPTAIAACAAAIDASGCGVAWSELPACKFKGTLSNGEACFGDASCASGDCMHTSDATSCGTCVDPGGVGASCDQNSCADGLVCDTAGKTTCVTAPKRGESGCVTKGCASSEDRCTANTCVAPLAEGAVCTNPGTGDTDPCIRGTQCAGGVCTARVREARRGMQRSRLLRGRRLRCRR